MNIDINPAQHSDDSMEAQKSRVETKWDQGVEKMKRLRKDTRDLGGQLASPDVQWW